MVLFLTAARGRRRGGSTYDDVDKDGDKKDLGPGDPRDQSGEPDIKRMRTTLDRPADTEMQKPALIKQGETSYWYT